MAFIEKKDPIVLNIKLTSKGRELLAKGMLNFKYYAIGDSEMDYEFNSNVLVDDVNFTPFNSKILRPADKNPEIISYISKSLTGDTLNEISSIPSTYYAVENEINPIGFFNSSATAFITDSNHVKQPDVMIKVNTVNGTKTLTLYKSTTYGISVEEPAIGDLLFVRWTIGTNTTGYNVTKTYPTPNLFYKITAKNGTLASGSMTVTVDRNLPDFTGLGLSSSIYAGAMIYYDQINYTGDTAFNMSATDYLSESVLSFLENSQCPTIVFPFWNMSIIFTEEIAGAALTDIKYTQFKNRDLGGFVSYIQNQVPYYKKLGVIHYTNSSPANVYGEGFLLNTPVLDIPTIMWHKSSTNTLGLTLTASGDSKILSGSTNSLNLRYYDLCDPNGYIIGKIFVDLKIFVIEDQELLFAMSYKSNRSWTLPNYTISL